MTIRTSPLSIAEEVIGDLRDKIAEALADEREESIQEGKRTATMEGYAEWEWELLYGTADDQEPPAGAKITLEWSERESPTEMIRRLTRERDDAQEVARIRLDTIDKMTETLGEIRDALED